MNLEKSIKDVIAAKLEDGTVEKLVSEELEKGIKKALDDLFGSWGEGTKVIKKNIESVMVPYLESYDYSKYVTKLDSVLATILRETSFENQKMLSNFQNLMTPEKLESITVSELYEKWCSHVSNNIDTDDLAICDDEYPATYYDVEVSFEFNEEDRPSWSSMDRGHVAFECEKDSNMNFIINVSRWGSNFNDGWDIYFEKSTDISSLKYLDEFSIFLMQLSQNGTKLILDQKYGSDEIEIEKEPEADVTYS